MSGYYIGVDIGGTFTDCVAIDDAGGRFFAKTPSTLATSPADAVVAGLGLLAQEAGVSLERLLEQTERFSHGTTIGTNLMVERKGAHVGLFATAGHGDALLMMRGNGRTAGVTPDRVFDVGASDKPPELVARQRIVELSERVVVDGGVLAPLDPDHARTKVVELLADEEIDAVAVSLLWSFRNDVHEQLLRRLIEETRPGIFVSISSETSPRQGEYERTVATVINSYVGPASSRYLRRLDQELRGRGLRRAPFIMQADGGVVPVGMAERLPVTTIGSGPAGGLAGTAAIARVSHHTNVIATDMGGTSFEVGLLIDGKPMLSGQQVVSQYAFHLSHLDVRSIACGGGSIAWVDPYSRALRVGPDSAGAVPGPACYGSGELPTVTDADVVLGLIDPDRFLGGRMPLDRARARAAIGELADRIGLTIEETAAGIVHINSHRAALLIRQRTIEQGLDPREFVIYAFGGAGPVHAFGFATELGVSEVVIPLGNGASLLSAYGIAASDVARSFERECQITAPVDREELERALGSVEAEAIAAMESAGYARQEMEIERTALMRYAEQYLQELRITLPHGPLQTTIGDWLAQTFEREYVRLYGEGARAVFQTIEIFAVRVTVRIPTSFAAAVPRNEFGPDVEVTAAQTRPVYWPAEYAWVPTGVHDGLRLRPNAVLIGPAIVELPHTAVAVATGQRLRTDAAGNLVLFVA